MGLRCSVLGHTFDETEVRRDRRERGESEVVTVVTQVERCSRCGSERIVSENKEVVSVVDADEIGLDDAVSAAAGSTAEVDEGATATPPAEEEKGTASTAPDDDATPPTEEEKETATEETEAADPSEEDVEFITETEGSLGGGDDVTEDVPSDVGGGIGGMAARSGAFGGDESSGADETGESAEDAEILDAPETERAPGQWPDEPDEGGPWEPETIGGADDDDDTTADAEPEVEPVTEPSFTVPEGSLRCPSCGNEVSADSSFRAGDACPECQTDYLEASEET